MHIITNPSNNLDLSVFIPTFSDVSFIYFFLGKLPIWGFIYLKIEFKKMPIFCRKSCKFTSSCNVLKQETRIYFYSLQRKHIKIEQNNNRQEEENRIHITQ